MPSNSTFQFIASLVIMFALLYFLIIRPQKKRENADRQMRNSLEPGDLIVTIGGLKGRVVSIKDDDTIIFETGADKNKIAIERWAVRSKTTPEEEE